MITDAQVRKYRRMRTNGTTQEAGALKAGMSAKTARKYERLGSLPSTTPRPKKRGSRQNPFAADWPWVVAQLAQDPALPATTVFEELCQQTPQRYQPMQLRTLQRHIAMWRAQHGPEQEVIFEQVHVPGERMQTDFTHMNDLQVSIQGEPFAHLVHHSVLTYSNVEAVRVCLSETFETLAEGIEAALWQFGGVPAQHRTDHLGAAIHPLPVEEQAAFKERYAALMRHYGMRPTLNNTGVAHENGDVEQSHYRFKDGVDQALRVRGSREFASRAHYDRFLQDLVRRRNGTRTPRWQAEREHLHPLPATPLAPCRELRVTVSRFSTILVLGNTYSVPSRLIRQGVLVRVRSEHLEVYVGSQLTMRMPRVLGTGHALIEYRHLIWSLARKPGAFAQYKYRDAFFPTLAFRQCYDHLTQAMPSRADKDYLHILHLAASTSEHEVQVALELLSEAGTLPSFDQIRALVQPPPIPSLAPVAVDLRMYDRLMEGTHG